MENNFVLEFEKEELERLRSAIIYARKIVRDTLDGSVEALEAMCKLSVIDYLLDFENKLSKLFIESEGKTNDKK